MFAVAKIEKDYQIILSKIPIIFPLHHLILESLGIRAVFGIYQPVDSTTPTALMNIDAVVVFHLAHYERALNRTNALNVAKFGEYEVLILLHIACANL